MVGPDMAPPASRAKGATPPSDSPGQRSGCPGFAGAPLDTLGGHEGFVPAIRASEVPAGAMKWVVLDYERVLIAHVDGAFYALADACGHRGASLSRGTLEDHVVECPLHFARFDVRTGKLLSGPTSADIPTYQVLVEGDAVYVKR